MKSGGDEVTAHRASWTLDDGDLLLLDGRVEVLHEVDLNRIRWVEREGRKDIRGGEGQRWHGRRKRTRLDHTTTTKQYIGERAAAGNTRKDYIAYVERRT